SRQKEIRGIFCRNREAVQRTNDGTVERRFRCCEDSGTLIREDDPAKGSAIARMRQGYGRARTPVSPPTPRLGYSISNASHCNPPLRSICKTTGSCGLTWPKAPRSELRESIGVWFKLWMTSP